MRVVRVLGWLVASFLRTFSAVSALIIHSFQCRDLRLIFLKKIRSPGIIVECPGFKLLDPDPDQVARDVMARLASA
jgi:hypothetical protein